MTAIDLAAIVTTERNAKARIPKGRKLENETGPIAVLFRSSSFSPRRLSIRRPTPDGKVQGKLD